jgi:hypothetical protein
MTDVEGVEQCYILFMICAAVFEDGGKDGC